VMLLFCADGKIRPESCVLSWSHGERCEPLSGESKNESANGKESNYLRKSRGKNVVISSREGAANNNALQRLT
jgi:hypothetical protein